MLVIGCMTAFMTAAYMTRAIWMTFFGEYRGARAPPHESPRVITVPALHPGRRPPSSLGFVNLPETFWLAGQRSRCASSTTSSRPFAFPAIEHPEFSFRLAACLDRCRPSPASRSACLVLRRQPRPARPHRAQRGGPRWGYRVLENKYYLDWLYTDVIVQAHQGPDRHGAYWFNQNVIDGVVNGAGTGVREAGQLRLRATSTRACVDRHRQRLGRRRPRAPARSCATSRPARCSSTPPSSSPAPPSSPASSSFIV